MSDEMHVGESAGAYVLGALSAQEAHDIETHAAACEQCHREIADLRQVVSVLPLACSSVEPSPDLKARILAAGRGEDQVDAILRRAVISSRRREPKHDVWHRSLPSWTGVAGWVGVAAACVIAGVFIGVADEKHRMLALQAPAPVAKTLGRVATAQNAAAESTFVVTADELDSSLALIGRSQVWDLSVSKTGERIPCKVIQPPHSDYAMVVTDMPMTKQGMVYRVWLVRKGKMHRGGTVMPGKMMQTTIPMKVQSGDIIAFSMERPGERGAPGGPFVMQQTL